MYRFYLPKSSFFNETVIIEDKKIINQLIKVLRAKHGDRFGFFYGDGKEVIGQLISSSPKKCEFLIIDEFFNQKEPDCEITLYQSLLKADKFDWLVQKVVELGVIKIIPVVSEFCIVRNLATSKVKRYEKIIQEAVEQCGGAKLPEFSNLISYEQAINQCFKENNLNLIAYEKAEKENSLKSIKSGKINIFIGPEGGYSQSEISLAQEFNFKVVSLGKRILRAETSAIVAVARLIG